METSNPNNLYSTPLHDFVAIDIEYADSAQNICQFGLAVVRNLQIVEQRCWNIQPPENKYEERYCLIHGMLPTDTINAPTLPEIWPEIELYLRGQQLWAHNASSTEQPVINKNLAKYNLLQELYTINDSRILYQRPDCPTNQGNGLEQCCMALGILCENHHNAQADAIMCAQIVIAHIEGTKPVWKGVPTSNEELRKQRQEKRILHLGEFIEYYNSNSSGEEDILCELTSTYDGAIPQIVDVFDKGDRLPIEKIGRVDFSRLKIGEDNPLYGKKVVLTGVFSIERREIELALEAMAAKKVPKPTKVTDAVILGTRNVGFSKLIAIEEQEAKGHHIARIVGDSDLETLLYGDGGKFFKKS